MTRIDDEPWYGVRCLFNLGESRDDPSMTRYEERIVLVRASSLDHAIEKAEEEAAAYASNIDADYIGLAQAFHIYDEMIGEHSEVFSLMRDSPLDNEAYIDRHFDTGTERQR